MTARSAHPILAARRLANGLTQEALAKRAKMDRSAVNQMENGGRSVGKVTAAKFAKVLGGSPVDYLWTAKRPIEIAEDLVRRLETGQDVPHDLRERVAAQMETTSQLCDHLAARLRQELADAH